MFKKNILQNFEGSLSDYKLWTGMNARNWASYFDNCISDNLDRSFLRNDFLNQNDINELCF